MTDINFNGMTMEFDVIESMMDTELKQEIKASLDSPSEQQILDAYLVAHKERFGNDFLQS